MLDRDTLADQLIDGIAELLDLALSRLGYNVRTVARANQGLDALEDRTCDLILVDLMMPGMDGKDFFHALRQRKPALARRVIFMTGAATDVDTQRFIADTGRPLLAKPFNLDELEQIVASELAIAIC